MKLDPRSTGSVLVPEATKLAEALAALRRCTDPKQPLFSGVVIARAFEGVTVMASNGRVLARMYLDGHGTFPATCLCEAEMLRLQEFALTHPGSAIRLERVIGAAGDLVLRVRPATAYEPRIELGCHFGELYNAAAVLDGRELRHRGIIERATLKNAAGGAGDVHLRLDADGLLAAGPEGAELLEADVDRPLAKTAVFDARTLRHALACCRGAKWVSIEFPVHDDHPVVALRPVKELPPVFTEATSLDVRHVVAVLPSRIIQHEEKPMARKTATDPNSMTHEEALRENAKLRGELAKLRNAAPDTMTLTGSVIEIRNFTTCEMRVSKEGARGVIHILTPNQSLHAAPTPAGPGVAAPAAEVAKLSPDALEPLDRKALAQLAAQYNIDPKGDPTALRERLGHVYLLHLPPRPEWASCDFLGGKPGPVWTIPIGDDDFACGANARTAILNGQAAKRLLAEADDALEGYFPTRTAP